MEAKHYLRTDLGFLVHGDCLEVMAGLKDNMFDLAFVDPPYNVGVNFIGYNDKRPEEEYWAWLQEVIDECCRLSCVVIVKHSASTIKEWCLRIKNNCRLIIWNKVWSSLGTKGFVTYQWEALWLVKGTPRKDTVISDVITVRSGIEKGSRRKGKLLRHPSRMPKGIAYKLLDKFVETGGVVFDPFAGSGTMPAVCEYLGYRWVAIEQSVIYCKDSARRITIAHKQRNRKYADK